ncbi:hypothetical protein ACFWJM_34125 [Streptomyces sp. NPDC127077]|uniref:hypothetical protein n=1 Tax=Streptomyces sp. NPDC127077 TaxID=3347131 RepID=UPI00364831CD
MRRHRDGGFVLEDQPYPERRPGGFARGQVSFTQRATAASSRSAAARRNTSHTPPSDNGTPNRPAISTPTRDSVLRSSAQP